MRSTTRTSSARRERRGFALALALIAIVVIGAMVASGYLAGVQDFRAGRNAVVQQRAFAAMELGLDSAYASWNKSWNSVKTGTTRVLTYGATDGSWVDTVRVTKLNTLSFLIVSEGRAGNQGTQLGARRRAAMIVRLDMPRINQPGAMVSRGTISIGGNTNIYGTDSVFAGWDCPTAGGAVAGALAPSWSNYTFRGNNCKGPSYACITGTPKADTSVVAADTTTYFSYGNQSWTTLVAQADKTLNGVYTNVQPSYNADGTCNTNDNNNWGDPRRAALVVGTPSGACEGYFPIIYAPGDLTVNGQMGQGMLLVGGNLSIQGNFTFYGQVITRGSVKLTGTGNHINGGVMAAVVYDSSASGGNQLAGTSTIQFSRCTLNAAFANTSLAARAPQRSWIELY
jgi:hypothetical protein